MGLFGFLKKEVSKEPVSIKNDVPKSEYLYFEEKYDNWVSYNKELLFDSSDYYDKKCCPECGSFIDQELKNSFICNSCKSKLLVRVNPDNKKKIIIAEKNKTIFDKQKQKLRELKAAEKDAQFIIEFYPNYKGLLLKQIMDKPNYDAIDIVYHFQNDVENSEKQTAMNTYLQLKQTNNINFNTAHTVTDRLMCLYTLSEHNMGLLFLQKKYNVIVSYLPILLYSELTTFIFMYDLLGYDYDEDMIISSGSSAYNLVFDLFKESDYTIEDLKKYYFEVVKEGIGFTPVDKKIVWDYIEKGINRTIKHREKIGR